MRTHSKLSLVSDERRRPWPVGLAVVVVVFRTSAPLPGPPAIQATSLTEVRCSCFTGVEVSRDEVEDCDVPDR
ncbi:hypothetical protein IMZ48_34065 [Candidatus Bathyarchaeota archaeon]|nr:hypothetical protein [Candidatus Bathyarchaeota archaeon]